MIQWTLSLAFVYIRFHFIIFNKPTVQLGFVPEIIVLIAYVGF